MSTSRFKVVQFRDEELARLVREASRSELGWQQPQQIDYLITYLSDAEADAKTVVCEESYTDRHYLEEYAGYYATCLRAPPGVTVRLHFFSELFEQDDFESLLVRAASGTDEYDEVQTQIQEGYLGFVVVRPIPSCPIGRTVLCTYQGKPDIRCFEPASILHDVHLAGVTLQVPAVPFQQQELAVGACATTALWSALARVSRADGARAPTPLSVTRAATRFRQTDRAFPALGGLDIFQMTSAIHALGYSPHVLKPDADPAAFQLQVKCYLRSGIPVVLMLDEGRGMYEQHAVAAVGFRDHELPECDEEPLPGPPLEIDAGSGATIHANGFERLYVHDDRVGPYASTVWMPPAEDSSRPRLELENRPHRFAVIKPWRAKVNYAIVPLYPKIRLSASDLTAIAGQSWPGIRSLFLEDDREHLRVDLRFVMGGTYLQDLYKSGVAPERAAKMSLGVRLSRYIGVVSFLFGRAPAVDIICDTTDILRNTPPLGPVLAFIAHSNTYVDALKGVAPTLKQDAVVY